MARLGLALVLALVVHVFFFMLGLPGRHDPLPELRGIREVKVRLYHPAPEPVEESGSPAVLERPGKPAAVEKQSIRKAAPMDERQSTAAPPEIIQPVSRKKSGPAEFPAAVPPPLPDLSEPAQESRREDRQATAAPGQDGPVAEKGLVRPAARVQQAVPRREVNRPPEYPDLARRRGWEGTVLLEVDVAGDGAVRSVRIRSGSSYGLLDDAALEAVRGWSFQPGTEGGRPVAMKVLVPVHFVLEDIQ